jgi:hypothetical protein
MVVAIVAMAVGVALLTGMAIMFIWSCLRRCLFPQRSDDPEKLRLSFI